MVTEAGGLLPWVRAESRAGIHRPAECISHHEMISQLISKLLKPTTEPPREWGRNEPCWCGSGKKYKVCHEDEDDKKRSSTRAAACRGAT
jgi:hypothetical protein